MRHHRQRLWQVVAGGLLLCIAGGTLSVAADSTNISGAVAQSYTAGSNVQTGMIVAAGQSSTVTPLSSSDITHMLGVVVPTSNATIILSPSTPSQQQVLVAATGRYNVLVSNQNGPVIAGNYITISSIDGVGMTAGIQQSEVVGRADTNFNGNDSSLGTTTLKNSQGKTVTVALGSVQADLDIAPNPLYQKTPALIPAFIDRFATNLAGQQVSAVRIYLAIVLLAITAFIVASILYGSSRGSMVALGRNPLSKQPIIRGLLLETMIVLIIFAVGLFAVYLLLKL